MISRLFRPDHCVQGEIILSFNDDFFLLRPHAITDFYSLLSGAVLRFDDGVSRSRDLLVSGLTVSSTSKSGQSGTAETLMTPARPADYGMRIICFPSASQDVFDRTFLTYPKSSRGVFITRRL